MQRRLMAGSLGLLVLLVGPMAARAQDGSSFSFTSEAGDYIGGGQFRSFTPDTASFQSSSSQNDNHVGGYLFPFDGGFWFFDFSRAGWAASRARRLRRRDAISVPGARCVGPEHLGGRSGLQHADGTIRSSRGGLWTIRLRRTVSRDVRAAL